MENPCGKVERKQSREREKKKNETKTELRIERNLKSGIGNVAALRNK